MRLVGFVALASLAAAAVLPASARAGKVLRTKTGAAVHWQRPVVSIEAAPQQASARLSAESVNEAIDEANAAWNVVPEMRVKLARGKPGETAAISVRFCRGTWPYPAGLLGHTEFEAALDSGVVESAVIYVNECDYKLVGPSEVEDGAFDLQAVLTHELGHVLGLGHSTDPKAVMFTNTGSVRQRRPTTDDRATLAEIYGAGPAVPSPAPATVVAPPAPVAAPKAPRPGTPANVVGVARLGEESPLVLYTCEPTILPAVARVEDERAPTIDLGPDFVGPPPLALIPPERLRAAPPRRGRPRAR